MESKYVLVSGFAFSESAEMKKLERYAREGWILEDIKGGLFYKLNKDKPQDIIYSLDYQSEANEEYFSIFKEAKWNKVLSLNNEIHIFSAKAGTKPIYSDRESELDKYIRMKNKTARGIKYSLITAIVLLCLSFVSVIYAKPIYFITLGLLMVNFCVFIFNFMPYIAYKSRINLIKKEGKCDNKVLENKLYFKLHTSTGVIFLFLGIIKLIEKKYFGIFETVIGVFFILEGANCYKKSKKLTR